MTTTNVERETLIEILEAFKNGLVSRATGGGLIESEYTTARKTLLGAPILKQKLPRFVTTCRNTDEFWGFIKAKFSTYEERRDFLSAELNPLIEMLERQQESTSTDLELGEQIGEGGFGTVYRATHALLGLDFAVKVFQPSFDDGNRADLDRFFREARILFSLNHPNIVRIHDAGIIAGRPFLRMEFFPGKNLNKFLEEHGPLPPAKARRFIEKVLDAMAHAHEAKVIHRDIKPSNVMLAPQEEVRVVDFGLGVFIENELVSRITRTGERAVGGHYTAPELLLEPRALHPSSDVYSIGAIWFAALTGFPPAGSDVSSRIDLLPISRTDKQVMIRSLGAKEMRFTSALEMLKALRS